jgi:hypothetical protein
MLADSETNQKYKKYTLTNQLADFGGVGGMCVRGVEELLYT